MNGQDSPFRMGWKQILKIIGKRSNLQKEGLEEDGEDEGEENYEEGVEEEHVEEVDEGEEPEYEE